MNSHIYNLQERTECTKTEPKLSLWVINYEIKDKAKGAAVVKAKNAKEAADILMADSDFNACRADFKISRIEEIITYGAYSGLIMEEYVRMENNFNNNDVVIKIPDNSITTSKIVDNAVTKDKIANGNVTSEHLQFSTVTIKEEEGRVGNFNKATLLHAQKGIPIVTRSSLSLLCDESGNRVAFKTINGESIIGKGDITIQNNNSKPDLVQPTQIGMWNNYPVYERIIRVSFPKSAPTFPNYILPVADSDYIISFTGVFWGVTNDGQELGKRMFSQDALKQEESYNIDLSEYINSNPYIVNVNMFLYLTYVSM